MKFKPKGKRDLDVMTLAEIKKYYAGQDLDKLTLVQLKILYERIALQSGVIEKPYREKKYEYSRIITQYFRAVSNVQQNDQLTLF